jgi:hypothetical protein
MTAGLAKPLEVTTCLIGGRLEPQFSIMKLSVVHGVEQGDKIAIVY